MISVSASGLLMRWISSGWSIKAFSAISWLMRWRAWSQSFLRILIRVCISKGNQFSTFCLSNIVIWLSSGLILWPILLIPENGQIKIIFSYQNISFHSKDIGSWSRIIQIWSDFLILFSKRRVSKLSLKRIKLFCGFSKWKSEIIQSKWIFSSLISSKK